MGRHSRSRSRSRRHRPRRRSRSPSTDSDRGHKRPGRDNRQRAPSVEAQYTIPATAPKIRVPELPIDIASFVDFVALYVSIGGSLVEDEIKAREKANPFFSFLFAPWNDPIAVYYRWRLHSLLQGDSLTRWHVEPFQIEQGEDKYVWVPPPQIAVGSDALAANPGEQIQPSAVWIARLVVDGGGFFAALSSADSVAWRKLLDLTACSGSDSGLATILGKGFIGERMVFVVERRAAAIHAVSIVLDHLAALALEAATTNQQAGADTDAKATRIAFHTLCYLFVLNDIGRNADAPEPWDVDEDAGLGAGRKTTPLASDNRKTSIRRGLELVAGPVLECLVRIAINLTPPNMRRVVSSAPPSHDSGDGVLPLEVHTSACFDLGIGSIGAGAGPADERTTLGMMLLSWTRSIYLEWFERDAVGRRSRIALAAKYSFVLGPEACIEHASV